MGFNPRADWIHATSPIPKVTLRLEQLKEARIQAREAMIKAQQSWVKHRDTPKYKEGDQVWLEGKNLRINQPTAKLAPRRHGPFKITQVMSAVNYRLELPTQWSIHPVFHINLLTPYKETIMHGPNFTRPTPELIDGEEEYSIEKILDSRVTFFLLINRAHNGLSLGPLRYFVIHSHHAQTMTHTPPIAD
jgi:hypothetical protein